MAKKQKIQYKYQIGDTVYVRPFILNGNGMSVYKCIVNERNYIGGNPPSPYYHLITTKESINLFVVYENEISLDVTMLKADAKKHVIDIYSPDIKAYKSYLKRLSLVK